MRAKPAKHTIPPPQPHLLLLRQVYECSADICLRAGDLGEALKCLRQLVELIYAALAAAQLHGATQLRVSSQSGLRSGVAPPPGLQLAPPVAASGADRAQQQQQQQGDFQAGAAAGAGLGALLTKPAFARWPEMAAALLLYYKCHQATAGEGLDTVITLRRLPRALLAREEVQRSLRLAAALGAGDFVAFFRALAGAPRTVQLLVQGRLAQVRVEARGWAGDRAGNARRAQGAVQAEQLANLRALWMFVLSSCRRSCSEQVRQQALASMAAAYRNIDTAAAARMLGLDDSRALLAALKALADRWVVAVAGQWQRAQWAPCGRLPPLAALQVVLQGENL